MCCALPCVAVQVQALEEVCAAHAEQEQQLHQQLAASNFQAQQQQEKLQLLQAALEEARRQHGQFSARLEQQQAEFDAQQRQQGELDEQQQRHPAKGGEQQGQAHREGACANGGAASQELQGMIDAQGRQIASLQVGSHGTSRSGLKGAGSCSPAHAQQQALRVCFRGLRVRAKFRQGAGLQNARCMRLMELRVGPQKPTAGEEGAGKGMRHEGS